MVATITRTAKAAVKLIVGCITYPYYRLLFLHRTTREFVITDGKFAIVNLDPQLTDDDYSRYFYSICLYFEHAGFNVVVKSSMRDIRNIRRVGFRENIWKENYTFVRTCTTPVNSVTLLEAGVPDHTIHFFYGYKILDRGSFSCIAPYPMHPKQYKLLLDDSFRNELAKSKRTMRISFSGKARKGMYADVRVKTFFNVMSRLEVIECIVDEYAANTRHLRTASDKKILEEILSSDDEVASITISEVKTEESDWLKFLWKSEFFICPPGARMPWSHNCVEAMSAGAIPILEYGSLFHPALEHKKNCLSYTNYEGLKSVIKMALEMQPGEIEVMRKNVFNYYEQYLSCNAISRRLIKFFYSPDSQLTIAIPFVPTMKEWRLIPRLE